MSSTFFLEKLLSMIPVVSWTSLFQLFENVSLMALILYCDQRDTPNPNLCSDLKFTLLLSFPGIVAFDNDIVHELINVMYVHNFESDYNSF